MKTKSIIKIVISLFFLTTSCKKSENVYIPFNFKAKDSTHIMFEIDEINKKKTYRVIFSKEYEVRLEELQWKNSFEIDSVPRIDIKIIRNALNNSDFKTINDNNYNFFAVIKIDHSKYKIIPLKYAGFAIYEYDDLPINEYLKKK